MEDTLSWKMLFKSKDLSKCTETKHSSQEDNIKVIHTKIKGDQIMKGWQKHRDLKDT